MPSLESKVHQCDYNGRYYCTTCHKKTLSPVPARILQNWDFKPRPLSGNNSKTFLLFRQLLKQTIIYHEQVIYVLTLFLSQLNRWTSSTTLYLKKPLT